MNGFSDYGIVGVLLLAIIMLIKDVIVPLLRKAGVMPTRNNPGINSGGTTKMGKEVTAMGKEVVRLGQELKSFKDSQEEWNDNIEKRLRIWDPNKNRR